jgi:hypothetical protein
MSRSRGLCQYVIDKHDPLDFGRSSNLDSVHDRPKFSEHHGLREMDAAWRTAKAKKWWTADLHSWSEPVEGIRRSKLGQGDCRQ